MQTSYKHLTTCSTILANKDMLIKKTMKYHIHLLDWQKLRYMLMSSVDGNVEQRKSLDTAGDSLN